MNKLTLTAVAIILLASCNQKPAEQPSATEDKPTETQHIQISKAQLASTKCLPCGDMELEEGQIADTTSVDGKIYGFCSPDCKASFVANPSQYLTQQ